MGLPNTCSERYQLTAMADAGVRLSSVYLHRGTVSFENGVVLPIVEMRDDDGDVTVDPEDCTEIDFGTKEFGYGTIAIQSRWFNVDN